jgi:hypothetical protein
MFSHGFIRAENRLFMADLISRSHLQPTDAVKRARATLLHPYPGTFMPTIDQQELGICAQQRDEEWEVLSVRLI